MLAEGSQVLSGCLGPGPGAAGNDYMQPTTIGDLDSL